MMSKIKGIEEMQAELSEVRSTLNALTENLSRTLCAAGKSYNFYEWLDEWLDYKSIYLAKKGMRDLRGVAKNYIKPKIPNKPMTEVTLADLQCLYDGVPPAVRENVYRIIRGSFTRAFDLHIIPVNISVDLERFNHVRNAGKALTSEQVAVLLEAVRGTPPENFIRFLLLTGCRRGEAELVEWDDIDFQAKTIHIRGTKTPNANRLLPFFGDMENLLKRIPRTEKTVFKRSHYGTEREIYAIREKCGFYFRYHDLRHTFATHCMECGIPLPILSRWLGHVSTAVTGAVYLHIGKQWQQSEVEKFKDYTKTVSE